MHGLEDAHILFDPNAEERVIVKRYAQGLIVLSAEECPRPKYMSGPLVEYIATGCEHCGGPYWQQLNPSTLVPEENWCDACVEKDEAELNNVDFDVDEEALEAIRETTYENYGITVEEFDKLYETESGQAKLAYLAEQIKLKKSM